MNSLIVPGHLATLPFPHDDLNDDTIRDAIRAMQQQSRSNGNKLSDTFVLNPDHRLDVQERESIERDLQVHILYDRSIPLNTIWCPDVQP